MKNSSLTILIFVLVVVLLAGCGPAPSAKPTEVSATAIVTQVTATRTLAPTATATDSPTATFTPSVTASPLLPTETPTPTPSETASAIPTATETIAQQLKSHIVFYLILPEKGRIDACGNISLIPIISKRLRTGDKLRDMQIGLQMLFDLGTKYYGPYYNALWDTKLTFNSIEYRKKEDYAIIDFGGFLPVMQMSKCDKHGVREQIWKTFFHYGFKEKTFKINGAFLIDQLNR